MITTDATWDATAAGAQLGVMLLIALDFASGVLRVTTWPLDVTVLGYTWTGLGQVARVGAIEESEDGNYEKLTVGLSQVASANLALAMGSPETYQGRDADIWVALVSPTTYQVVGTPIRRFAGKMEQVEVPAREADGSGVVLLHLQAGSYDRRNNPAALRMNQQQHAARHPGETGFRFTPDLIGKPKQWLSSRFQQRV